LLGVYHHGRHNEVGPQQWKVFTQLFHFRTFKLEISNQVSITNLFSNLQDRLELLLPKCANLPANFVKSHFKLTGKMYRSKREKSATSSEFNTICSLTSSSANDCSYYFVNGKFVVKSDPFFDQILGKLDLMYSVRQSYHMEGFSLAISKDSTDHVIKCATIHSGSEAVAIVVEISESHVKEILEIVFPDLTQIDSPVRLVELTEPVINELSNEYTNYFNVIVKTVKLNLI
jgi:hypothetical protein